MYELTIKTSFSAAHQLIGYEGACEDLHGHNWKIEIRIKTDKLNEIGLAMDFKDIKKAAGKAIGKLDHKFLNQVPPFQQINPSCENIANFLFTEISKEINTESIKVSKITVWETENCGASYSL